MSRPWSVWHYVCKGFDAARIEAWNIWTIALNGRCHTNVTHLSMTEPWFLLWIFRLAVTVLDSWDNIICKLFCRQWNIKETSTVWYLFVRIIHRHQQTDIAHQWQPVHSWHVFVLVCVFSLKRRWSNYDATYTLWSCKRLYGHLNFMFIYINELMR